MTIRQLIVDLSSYLRWGDECLRRQSSSVVFDFIRLMYKKGVDTRRAISSILPKLESLERSYRQLKMAWLSVATRCTFILAVALILRFFISNISMNTDTDDLFFIDRTLMVVSGLVLLVLIVCLYNHYLRKFKYNERNECIWLFVKAFVDIDYEALECPQIASPIRKLLSEQLHSGLDTSDVRRSLVISQITYLHEEIENELRSLGLFGVGVELVVYGLGFVGFVGGPFLMFLESASGFN